MVSQSSSYTNPSVEKIAAVQVGVIWDASFVPVARTTAMVLLGEEPHTTMTCLLGTHPAAAPVPDAGFEAWADCTC